MTDLTAVSGTWNLDVAHTRLGFAAKHAMVTTVRGAFARVRGQPDPGRRATPPPRSAAGHHPGRQLRQRQRPARRARPRRRLPGRRELPDPDLPLDPGPPRRRRLRPRRRPDHPRHHPPGRDRGRARGRRERPVGQPADRVLRRDHDQPQGLRPDLERPARRRRPPGLGQGQDHPGRLGSPRRGPRRGDPGRRQRLTPARPLILGGSGATRRRQPEPLKINLRCRGGRSRAVLRTRRSAPRGRAPRGCARARGRRGRS